MAAMEPGIDDLLASPDEGALVEAIAELWEQTAPDEEAEVNEPSDRTHALA